MKKIDIEIIFISGLLLLVGFVIGILTNNLINNQKEQEVLMEKLRQQSELNPENEVHLFQERTKKHQKDSKIMHPKSSHRVKIS
jgi:uncharacterized membrane-anchored protein YhcB (DUF1043 family)